MTIIESVKEVLKDSLNGLTIDDIFDSIIKRKLYNFNAKKPKEVVKGEIRRHCLNLDFPTASPVKHFYIVGMSGKKPVFNILTNEISSNYKSEKTMNSDDLLPEEKVEKVVCEYNNEIKEQLMDKIMHHDPAFFERLVVNLLLKMGYGYDNSAGKVVGRSHDGGIDGIISEDKLGLDLIYIQAKRYKKNVAVGRRELQAFIGAMQGVEKGVFITTSKFTKESLEFVEKIQHKHIGLIDGERLCELMIKNEVGVQSIKVYNLLKIDEDFFNDEAN